ncbi:integrase core domain-containing protein, partial [Patescibacteria group bacterium]|nr:integrase core domain-containing protein [Patescibacteria group bacterium]
KVKHPYTNGKAERVIRTIMDMWHDKTEFKSRQHRRTELIRFINFYNTVKLTRESIIKPLWRN